MECIGSWANQRIVFNSRYAFVLIARSYYSSFRVVLQIISHKNLPNDCGQRHNASSRRLTKSGLPNFFPTFTMSPCKSDCQAFHRATPWTGQPFTKFDTLWCKSSDRALAPGTRHPAPGARRPAPAISRTQADSMQ
jgi:hypothetical protein